MLYYTMFAQRGRRLGVCQKSTLDNRLYEMRERDEPAFTGAADLVTISEILGHKDLKTTRQYLGLTVEDQQEALELRYRTQLQVRQALRANPKNPEVQPSQRMNG